METVESCMTKKVITVGLDESVSSAAKKMDKNNISSLVVIENEKPVGIITERDIIKKIVAKEKDPKTAKIGSVCSMKIITINANESIAQASNLMALGKIKQLPVLKNGKLVGIITSTDIVRVIKLMKEDLLKI